jgi:hypothetical protein
MGKTPVRSARPVLCLEVEVGPFGGAARIRVTASIPGREGTSTREWAVRNGWVDARHVDDVVLWLTRSLQDALIASGSGVQQVGL